MKKLRYTKDTEIIRLLSVEDTVPRLQKNEAAF
jgi:hypothetical protein